MLNISNLFLVPEKENVEILKVNEPNFPILIEPEEEINFVYIFPNYESILSSVSISRFKLGEF